MAKKFAQLVIESDSDSDQEGNASVASGTTSMTKSNAGYDDSLATSSHLFTHRSDDDKSNYLTDNYSTIQSNVSQYSRGDFLTSHSPKSPNFEIRQQSDAVGQPIPPPAKTTSYEANSTSWGHRLPELRSAALGSPQGGSLSNDDATLRHEVQSKIEIIKSLEENMAIKDNKMNRLEQEISELEEVLHDRDQRISKLEGEVYQLDQARMRTQEESRTHARRITDLEAELAHAEKMKAQLNQKLNEQAACIENLEEKLYVGRSAPVQYDSILQEVKELRSKMKTLEAHRDSKQLMNEKLTAQIRELSGNDERLHDIIAKCMQDIGARNAQIEDLRRQCWALEEKVEALKDPVSMINDLEHKLREATENLNAAESKQREVEITQEGSVNELKEEIMLLQLEISDRQRVIDAYATDADVIAVANCLKELRLRDKCFYDFFMAIIMWESNPLIPASDRGVVMDIKDAIRLAEKGLLSLRVVQKCHRRRQEGTYLRHPPNLYGKPLWSESIVSPSTLKKSRGLEDLLPEKIRQESCDCAVRLLDFMDQHQIMEVAKYMCATPLLAEWAMTEQQTAKNKPPPVPRNQHVSMTPAIPQPNDGECVCFTIYRGPEKHEEKWMEFTDSKTGCQYYHNPKTGATQWDFPVKVDRNT